jgi:hypothetical protein
MRTVEIGLRPSELSGAMAEMRIWLDDHRFEPSAFCCRDVGAGVLVRVDFKITDEADAFADRFGGRVEQASTAPGGPDHMRDPSSALSPEGVVG